MAPVPCTPKLIRTILGRFLELFSRFEFEFCRRGNSFKKTHSIFVCSEFNLIQCDCTCACAVTDADTQQTDTHTQTTYTAQTHRISMPTVVASL